MKLEVEKENLCINKIVGHKKENIIVEGDIIVPDVKPDIINTISTSGNVCVYKKEVMDAKVRIDGKVDVYVIYLAEDQSDNARSLNASIDFTNVLELTNCMSGMEVDLRTKIKTIECKILNERKISIKVTLEVELKVYSNEEFSMVKNIGEIEDMKYLRNNMQIDSLIGTGQTSTTAKDTVIIENIDNIMEILKTNVNILNADTKISYNKVLAKADACVKIMYLTDDGRIKTVESIIPIMGFIDIPDITEDSMCDTYFELKNIVINPNSTEEHSILVELEIEICAKVYQKKEMELIQDLYNPCKKIEFTEKQIKTMTSKQKNENICHINEKINTAEINENQIYDVESNVNILETKVMNNRVLYEGEINLNVIFQSDNVAKIDTKNYKISFRHEVEIQNIDQNTVVDTKVEISRQDFILSNSGSLECNIDMIFKLNTYNMEVINIIDNIEMDEQEENQYSMTIYFVKPGDTLWNIAKRFKSTVEDIVRVNEIEDENKIYPRQQLFIPKYVSRMKSVSA